MKKVSIALLLIVVAILPLQAGWIKTYGGENDERGYTIQATTDGGYVVFGSIFTPDDSSEMLLLKTDNLGDMIWMKTFGGNGDGYCNSGLVADDGGYVLFGSIVPAGDTINDYYVLKTDEDGDTLWSRTYGGPAYDVAFSGQQTDDGGYIITGFNDGTKADDGGIYPGDMLLVKTNQSGDTTWTKRYGVEGKNELGGEFIIQSSDGGYFIACNIDFSQIFQDRIVLMKTDTSGDSLWTYRDRAYYSCVVETEDNHFIALGNSYFDDLLLVKFKMDGTLVWKKSYEVTGENYYYGNCIKETPDGGFVFAGTFSQRGGVDAFLSKTDSNGDTLWTRTYSDPQDNWAACVTPLSDGYILTGSLESWTEASTELLIIKTDTLGNVAIEEKPTATFDNSFDLLSPIGREIVLRYSDRVDGFHAEIFDASGRKVAEIHSMSSSGTLTWGVDFVPGVYFIREISGTSLSATKVILIK